MNISDIQRNFKISFDFRNNETNERKTIYEIGPNQHYTLVHKKDGQVLELKHAQNALTLILKNICGAGWKSTEIK